MHEQGEDILHGQCGSGYLPALDGVSWSVRNLNSSLCRMSSISASSKIPIKSTTRHPLWPRSVKIFSVALPGPSRMLTKSTLSSLRPRCVNHLLALKTNLSHMGWERGGSMCFCKRWAAEKFIILTFSFGSNLAIICLESMTIEVSGVKGQPHRLWPHSPLRYRYNYPLYYLRLRNIGSDEHVGLPDRFRSRARGVWVCAD